MQVVSVVPGDPSSARAEERDDPAPGDGSVLVRGRLMGICGTDVEIVEQGYGEPPAGRPRLVLGHESLGEVVEAPADSGLAAGDLVAGYVRRPDPVPCACCAQDRPDFCRNGRYVESGIKGRDGYGAQRWRADPDHLVRLDPSLGDAGVLLEPTSVVAKAWAQADAVGSRACWAPERVLVVGAGPIGLLGALLGIERGLEVHVVDRVTDGPKPGLVADLGATYHTGNVAALEGDFDVVLECTGIGTVVTACARRTRPGGVVVLLGLRSGEGMSSAPLDAVNHDIVLGNVAVVGSVNAWRADYDAAAGALARADRSWLQRLVTRRVPIGSWADGLGKTAGDVKVVVDLQG